MFNILFVAFTLFACTYGQDYKAVDELDLSKYVGHWYQVYGDNFNRIFQGNGKCSTADYELLDDGRVSVLNKQLSNKNAQETISGYAYYINDDCCGYLTVQLEGTPEAPYWVLEVGPIVNDYYDYAIVSDNFALSLFVLARNVEDFYKYYNDDVKKSLYDLGFNQIWSYPVPMNQTDCSYY